MSGTTGVLGHAWRATVTPYGDVVPWTDEPTLGWYVAADDRWYSPQAETTVRQVQIDGTPVFETRVRIPKGDAVQRVWSVADGGGLTLVEVVNESPMPIAVAFTRGDVLTARPPADVPIEGIDLPAGSIVLPVGHQAAVTVALRHDGGGAGPLPAGVPTALQVARGWTGVADRASRLVLPDAALATAVTSARCELALAGPELPDDHPAMFLVQVGQLVRMGEPAEPWLVDVAHAVETMMARDGDVESWLMDAAFDGTAVVLHAAEQSRALRDLSKVRARWGRGAEALPPRSAPDDAAMLLAWIDRWCVSSNGGLLPLGLPDAWLGAQVEVYDAPVGASKVSYALRWHGERPAVLWEVTGEPVHLTAPALAPGWSTDAASGEALWPTPPNAVLPTVMEATREDTSRAMPPTDDGVSFS
jgi:hypothetical protein